MFLDFFYHIHVSWSHCAEQQNMREIRAINFIIFVGLVFYTVRYSNPTTLLDRTVDVLAFFMFLFSYLSHYLHSHH